MDTLNETVYQACLNLLCNLECDKFYDHPFTIPFMRYVSLWPYSLPVKTIIIGQNPYPQNIYPEYGAALSYSEEKCRSIPASVSVICEDLYNICGVPKIDTMRCFRDLWMMVEHGVICINESVFSRLVASESTSNLRSIRESEFQIRTLQVLLAESYTMGQISFTCIGMGMSAAMMINTLRQWCPNDLISMKCITCPNPAAYARSLGDTGSHPITFGNSTLSKVFQSIVKEYTSMPPKRDDKRTQQNIESFKKCTENVMSSADNVRREYSSFIERLKSTKKLPDADTTKEDFVDSLNGLVSATDSHANAIRAHMMSFVIASRSIMSQCNTKQDATGSSVSTIQSFSQLNALPSPEPLSPHLQSSTNILRRPVRRVVNSTRRASDFSSQSVGSIAEEPNAQRATSIALDSTETKTTNITPSRRRRVQRVSSDATSVAGTEYTTMSTSSAAALVVGSKETIGAIEGVHMNAIAYWFSCNMGGDTTYSEMVQVTVEEKVVASEFARSVLSYVRSRIAQSIDYDAYDELSQENSPTIQWCRDSIQKINNPVSA